MALLLRLDYRKYLKLLFDLSSCVSTCMNERGIWLATRSNCWLVVFLICLLLDRWRDFLIRIYLFTDIEQSRADKCIVLWIEFNVQWSLCFLVKSKINMSFHSIIMSVNIFYPQSKSLLWLKSTELWRFTINVALENRSHHTIIDARMEHI